MGKEPWSKAMFILSSHSEYEVLTEFSPRQLSKLNKSAKIDVQVPVYICMKQKRKKTRMHWSEHLINQTVAMVFMELAI